MRHFFPYALPVVILLSSSVTQAQDAAHALAQKFAVEEKSAQKPATAPQAKPKAPSASAERAQPAPRPAATSDDESEMLNAARAEAEARKAQDNAAAAKAAAPAAVAESKPAAAPAPAPAAPPAPATPAAPEAKSKAPAAPVQIKIDAQIKSPAVSAPPARDASAPRASVLVVLSHHDDEPGTFPKTFDPVICFADTCYVSTGTASEATLVSRAQVLSTKNTITAGAGACAGKAACAFRGVSVPPAAQLQIVDLGLVKHDRRDTIEAKIDTTCAADQGDLICSNPLTAPDYRVWIVPEQLAASLKPESLEAALADELPEENVTLDTDK